MAVFLHHPGAALAQQLGHFLAALGTIFSLFFSVKVLSGGILIFMFKGRESGSGCEENQYRSDKRYVRFTQFVGYFHITV